jgi:hypothetical protein
MTSYRPGIATVPPPTLAKQLEVLAAAHGLAAQDDEAVRWRREEIAAVRREVGELARLNQVLQRQWGELVQVDQEQRRRDPRLRSPIIKYNADQPRVPAGEHGGGQWTSGGDGGAESDTRDVPAAAAAPGSQRRPQYAQANPGTRTDATGDGGNVSAAAAQQHPDFAHDVGNAIEEVKARIHNEPRKFDIISSNSIPADSPKRPEVFTDSSGQPILDGQGKPILRPDDLPPETYVQAGLIAGSHNLADNLHNALQALQGDLSGALDAYPLIAALIGTGQDLLPFIHGGSLDAERFESNYVQEYRHYTSIALGIFMAAAGVSREDMLSIANAYAKRFSTFSAKEVPDERYTSSAQQDIEDNLRGYELYESGRIRLKN